MNDEKTDETVDEGQKTHDSSYSEPASGGGRSLLLFGLLAAIAAAACYKFLLMDPAQKSFQEASNKLNEMQTLAKDDDGELIKTEDGKLLKIGDIDQDGFITPEDVGKTLDREPTETVEVTETGTYEKYSYTVYSWTGPASRDLYVLYNKMGDEAKPRFFSTKNETPTKDMFRSKVISNPNAPNPALGGGAPAAGGDEDSDGDSDEDSKSEGEGGSKAGDGSDKK